MTRREFVGGAALAAVSAGATMAAGAAATEPAKPPADKPRNRRPYAGLDWSKVIRVKTTSHGHCPTQWYLDQYLKRGFGLITMSNYYPSAPWWPASKMTKNYWRLHHDHPVMVNGKRVPGPFDWNKIIAPWKHMLSAAEAAKQPAWAAKYPFVEGEKIFKPLPPGVLEAPNAEHHSFLLEDGRHAASLHMCSPGSAFASGTFDAHNLSKTYSHGYNYGSGEFWGTAVDRMIAGLIHPDGGGVTINHPSWTRLDRELMLKILDHDPRVLGIEVIEDSGHNSENYWDWALSTGRQCFGFFVPDWQRERAVRTGEDRPCLPEGVPRRQLLRSAERTRRTCLHAHRVRREEQDRDRRDGQAGQVRGHHGARRREGGEGDGGVVDGRAGQPVEGLEDTRLRPRQGVFGRRLRRGALLAAVHAIGLGPGVHAGAADLI